MHVIKKQVIELKVPDGQNVFRLQHLISDHYRNEMIPVLESVFNDYCSEDEVLILDKLEIDFGVISEKELEKNRWGKDVLATFKSNLLENLTALSVNKTFVRRPRAMNSCWQWISYMQKGYLPWNTIVIDDKWYQDVLETLATDYSSVAILRKLLLNEDFFAYRVSQQHDAVFLSKLAEVVTAQSQKQLPQATEEIITIIKQVRIHRKQPALAYDFIKTIWKEILIVAAGRERNLSTENIAAVVLGHYILKLPVKKRQQKKLLSMVTFLKEVLLAFFELNNVPADNQKLPEQVNKEQKEYNDFFSKPKNIEEINRVKISVGYKDDGQNEQKDLKEQFESNDSKKNEPLLSDLLKRGAVRNKNQQEEKFSIDAEADKNLKEQPINPTVSSENRMEDMVSKNSLVKNLKQDRHQLLLESIPPEGIFIQHAGLILTHPFLGSLFRRLQWMQNNEFINDEAQVKAIFILHYLATGETIAAEYELVICKLLSGYPLDKPMSAEMIFTEDELPEARDMLTALMQQWEKLKNTSIDGLREAFLRRSGKLFIKNDSIHVQVESHAIDVLLDYLPWNLSLIKLPWLKELIKVEWR